MRTKPRKAFDLAEVERLASLGLTREQIAAALGASASTVYNRLRDDEAVSYTHLVKPPFCRPLLPVPSCAPGSPTIWPN